MLEPLTYEKKSFNHMEVTTSTTEEIGKNEPVIT